MRDPGGVLDQAAQTLELTRPTAVLLLAISHFIPDADDSRGIVARLAAGLAPGSFVAVSHLTADFAPEQVASAVAAYNALVPVGGDGAQPCRGDGVVRWDVACCAGGGSGG